MSEQQQDILGIDIAKKTFQVALLSNNKFKHKSFENNLKGFHALSHWLNKLNITLLHACLEATGSYGEALAQYLFDVGFKVSVVNPAKIKGFAQCQLIRLKSDKADATLIAHYCATMNPTLWQPEPLCIQQLQGLVRRLDELIVALNQEQNRLDVAPDIIRSSIEKQIQSHINQYPDLKQQAELLQTIPGVGTATIAQVLAFMSDLTRFDNAKQYVAFLGLNPKQYSSGTSVKGKTRISKTGSSSLRRAFYMPALTAITYNPIIKTFSERLKKAGKKGKLVVCAAMRKLVHIIYGVLKSGQPFNVNRAIRS
jgi:transposase